MHFFPLKKPVAVHVFRARARYLRFVFSVIIVAIIVISRLAVVVRRRRKKQSPLPVTIKNYPLLPSINHCRLSFVSFSDHSLPSTRLPYRSPPGDTRATRLKSCTFRVKIKRNPFERRVIITRITMPSSERPTTTTTGLPSNRPLLKGP